MATVAELRMDVDSRPVKNAGRDLDQLSQKAERTERSARKLGEGARRAGRGLDDYAREARESARQTSAFESALGRTLGRVAKFTVGILAARAAVRGFFAGLKAADDFRALDNRIKLVTKSAEEFAQVQTGLIDISRRTFSSIEGTVQAYQRMAGATDRLGISQERLLGVAETVNKAVALSGATSQAAEASLIQFGQALSNNFQASAQEINSLNEQVFALSDAIARGITKITGVETFRSDLKGLAEDGRLSSELVIAALEAVKEETDKTFGDLDRTFAQTAQRIKTNAQIISDEAFGPLLQVKIDFYTKFAEALEDPRTIAAAQKFGATLVDIARGFEKNGESIIKTIQGITASIGVLVGAGLISFVSNAIKSFQAWLAVTTQVSIARVAATKAELEYNAAIASGAAIALESTVAQKARAAFTLEQARADQVAAAARIADIRAAKGQLAANLELITAQRAQAASQVELTRGIAIATGRRAQLAAAEASLARSMAAGIATRKALVGVESELVAAESAHAAATSRLTVAQTAYATASTAAAAKVGFFGRALLQLRGVITGLSALIAANPLGVIVVGLTAAIYAIVKFRDEITRALTPFGSFKELADEVGPAFKGAFAVASDAAESLMQVLRGLSGIISDVLEGLNELLNRSSEPLGINGFAYNLGQSLRRSIGGALGDVYEDLRARGLLDERNAASRRSLSQAANDNVFRANSLGLPQGITSEIGGIAGAFDNAAELALAYEKNVRSAVHATGDLGETADDALKRLRDGFAGSTEEADKLRIAAEKAKRALASDVSSTFLDFKIGEGLGQFTGLDLGGFSQAGRDGIFSEFERKIDELTRAIESDDSLSASVRAQQLGRLSDVYDEFLDEYEAANEDHVRRFKDAVQSVTAGFLDDLLFNGGRGLGDFFRNAIRDVGRAAIIDPISKALSGDGDIFGNLKNDFKTLTDNFAKAGGSIASSISESLQGIGEKLGAALGGALAGFGLGNGLGDLFGLSKGSTGRRTLTGGATGAGIGLAVAGPIGAAVGAIAGALGGAISGLFGRKTATGSVDLSTGGLSGLKNSKKESGARNDRRDTILQAVSQVAAQFADALGTTVSRGISLQVEAGKKNITTTLRDASGRVLGSSTSGKDDVEGAFEAALKLVIDKAFSGGNQTLKDFASSALAAGRSIDEVISVLRVLNDVSKSGQKALSDYALVAAKAGRSSEQIVQGVQALANVYALTEKPLSEIAQQLKNIDDAVDPVIADLKSLGQSFAEIASIGDAAAKALGENFIQGIRDLNIDLQNSVFGNFNKLLQEIRQREEDAALLLQRGAISSQQFGFVQSTGGLQVSKFFEGLSDDDKESLADFLGLLRTASGDIAVARVKLEEQFDYLIDNVEETARGFEEAAQNFERLSQNLSQTADAIRTEFSGLTPRDNVVTLQGRVAELLAQARDETATTQSRQSALEALPSTVTQLVEKARQAFGGTEQFARIRDFGLSALDSSATLADELAKFNYAQADAAREDVGLLTDIRELLNDDRQLPTLQSILDEGRLTNQLIAQQLQAFLNLMSTAGSNINQITADELQQAAAAYLSQQQAAIASQTTSPSSTPVTGLSTVTDAQIAQALVDLSTSNDSNTKAVTSMSNDIDDLTAEIRRLLVKLAA